MISIEQALVADAPMILELQRLAFLSEAELYEDFAIPPLTQTLEELKQDFDSKKFIKAVDDGILVGSVNASLRDQRCLIGRLMVHPMYQGQGLGRRLMLAVEEHFPAAASYQLFTGERSERNIGLYRSLGYEIFRFQAVPGSFGIVFMKKEPVR